MHSTSAHIRTAATAILAVAAPLVAQTAPNEGIRVAEVRTHAITDATVVIRPGERIEGATIVIRNGVIADVGVGVTVPAEARVWSGTGLVVYPGLIDAAVYVEVPSTTRSGSAHWNPRIRAERRMAVDVWPQATLRKSLREIGFTAAAVYPADGILRGTGAVVAMTEDETHLTVYKDTVAMAAGFDRGGRGGDGPAYPRSLMGAMALFRQTIHDARWHAETQRVWRADPSGHEPPQPAETLEALFDVSHGVQPMLFDAGSEHDLLRADRLAAEFGIELLVVASGNEFRRLPEVVATGRPLIVPLRYPDRPDLSTLSSAATVDLRTLMTWEQAPTNPRRLLEAGMTVALTTARLEKRKEFPAALAKAIKQGLDTEDALAALTTTPAELLGVSDLMGTIETGKAANLVVVEGDLFAKKPKLRDVWIDGRRHEIKAPPGPSFEGAGELVAGDLGITLRVDLDTTKKSLVIHHGEKKSRAKKVVVMQDRISAVLDGAPFGEEGIVRIAGVLSGDRIVGSGVLATGEPFSFDIVGVPDEPSDDDEADQDDPDDTDGSTAMTQPAVDDERGSPVRANAAISVADETDVKRGTAGEEDEDDQDEDDDEDADDEDAAEEPVPETLRFPIGAYGSLTPPTPETVAVVGATIWTSGPLGVIENGAILVRDGAIRYVGPADGFSVPDDATLIDGTLKHVSPGLIDCHSHTAISGGVNEGTQAVTAEVRIADVINPDDVNIYRQLAGGLTAANQLHGSANPIGGQNSVIKLKWGTSAKQMRVPDAIEGIKFALGENVKRSPTRYPNTRMGVETIIRDAFVAAIDYKNRWDRYLDLDTDERDRTMPPRRDLELDALVEILEGRRLVHSHSYRQDEILMLIRLAESFGFTIGTFQHVLEGYKVADAIAAHGAGASTFSDWWAYKMEVMDAVPYNGAIMHDQGVVVSFNSDSSELARRMNTEAAKAVRYGGIDPAEALEFVTLNPAKQLRIDLRTGSLEKGKDGDFVIWSGSPLSTFSRCEQTWIEGVRYFDLETDGRLREEARAERTRLVQKVLRLAHARGGSKSKDKDEAEPDEGGRRPGRFGGRRRRPTEEDDQPYSCCWEHEHK